jgi:hypothetical protein
MVDRTQRVDLIREIEVAVEGGCEGEMGARCQVVHELRHRSPFVGLAAP